MTSAGVSAAAYTNCSPPALPGSAVFVQDPLFTRVYTDGRPLDTSSAVDWNAHW